MDMIICFLLSFVLLKLLIGILFSTLLQLLSFCIMAKLLSDSFFQVFSCWPNNSPSTVLHANILIYRMKNVVFLVLFHIKGFMLRGKQILGHTFPIKFHKALSVFFAAVLISNCSHIARNLVHPVFISHVNKKYYIFRHIFIIQYTNLYLFSVIRVSIYNRL